MEREFNISVITTIKVADQDLEDLLETAFGPAGSDWIERLEIIYYGTGEQDSHHSYTYQVAKEDAQMKVRVEDDDKPYYLDRQILLAGIEAYVKEGYNLPVFNERLEFSEIDAPMADEIIQFALFGKIIYS